MMLRSLGASDRKALFAIVQECQKKNNLGAEFDWTEQALGESLESGAGLGAFDEVAGELRGFVIYKDLSLKNESQGTETQGGETQGTEEGRGAQGGSPSDDPSASMDLLEIICLATAPRFQRQGVMELLLETLRSRAREIWLEVHGGNGRAIAFYQKMGFVTVGRRKNYYKDGGEALLLSLESSL